MPVKRSFPLLLFFVLLISQDVKASVNDSAVVCVGDSFGSADSGCILVSVAPVTSDSVKSSSAPKHKRLVAAILSFPVPFGILGGHRIYFGTKPYMPFVYIATLGGCFGILPLIDFIAILISDDKTFDRFSNNPGVFMWSK